MRFRMALHEYELPQTASVGVDSAAWEAWRIAVRREAEPRHIGWFEYSLERVFELPELYGLGGLKSARKTSVFATRRRLDARLA